MNLIDSHAHLNDNRFAHDTEDVLARAVASGITAIINVGYDVVSSRDVVALAASHPFLFAAVGIHPHDAKSVTAETLHELGCLLKAGKVVALGEIGLDYFYDHSPRQVQRDAFRAQIRLARECSLPIIVHDRDAHLDVMDILRQEEAGEVGGVMHCFSGDVALARECLNLGFYLSLAGPVTFKNAADVTEVARFVPLDRLLLETDAPYLAPVPWRGKRNEPAYVRQVAEKVAQIRGQDLSIIAEQTCENARKLFGLEP